MRILFSLIVRLAVFVRQKLFLTPAILRKILKGFTFTKSICIGTDTNTFEITKCYTFPKKKTTITNSCMCDIKMKSTETFNYIFINLVTHLFLFMWCVTRNILFGLHRRRMKNESFSVCCNYNSHHVETNYNKINVTWHIYWERKKQMNITDRSPSAGQGKTSRLFSPHSRRHWSKIWSLSHNSCKTTNISKVLHSAVSPLICSIKRIMLFISFKHKSRDESNQ